MEVEARNAADKAAELLRMQWNKQVIESSEENLALLDRAMAKLGFEHYFNRIALALEPVGTVGVERAFYDGSNSHLLGHLVAVSAVTLTGQRPYYWPPLEGPAGRSIGGSLVSAHKRAGYWEYSTSRLTPVLYILQDDENEPIHPPPIYFNILKNTGSCILGYAGMYENFLNHSREKTEAEREKDRLPFSRSLMVRPTEERTTTTRIIVPGEYRKGEIPFDESKLAYYQDLLAAYLPDFIDGHYAVLPKN